MLYSDRMVGYNDNQMEKLFAVNDHKKDFAKWFLNVVFNIKDDPFKVHDFSVGPFMDAVGIAMMNNLDVLHPTNIAIMKDWICNNQNLSYCEGITKESIESTYQKCEFCSISLKDNYFISLHYKQDSYLFAIGYFKRFLTWLWLFDKYWTSEKILEYYLHNWYNNPEYSSSKLKH